MYKYFIVFLSILLLLIKTDGVCLRELVPDQIRLAFAGDDGVSVGWHSYGCLLSTKNPNPNPTVIYGLSPTSLNFVSVDGESSVYDTRNILKVSWFYSVELPNLQPSTIYYYQIVGEGYVSSSSILSFTSAPILGYQNKPVNLISYADLGVDGLLGDIFNGPHLFERALGAIQIILPSVDFVLHHGDICYADDTLFGVFHSYEESFNYCQRMMTNITSAKFYMTTVGNHEINCTEVSFLSKYCSSDHKDQLPYSHRFHMPSKQSNGYSNSWYSFNYAFVHVISLSCESDFPNAPSENLIDTTTQINWLKSDLASIDRSKTPWVIVQCHRPWRGSTAVDDILEGGILNCPSCRAAFEDLLIEYNVDIYLTGHVHWYERICLNSKSFFLSFHLKEIFLSIFQDTINTTNYVNPDSPVYLTVGSIGSPEGSSQLYRRSDDSCFLSTEPGLGKLTLLNPSFATFTFYRTSDLTIIDQIQIIKER